MDNFKCPNQWPRGPKNCEKGPLAKMAKNHLDWIVMFFSIIV